MMRKNTSPLRTSLYFLSCKHCSENKTARTRVCQLILLESFTVLSSYCWSTLNCTRSTIPESQGHLSTAKPRKRALSHYFYPNLVLSNKLFSWEIIPLLQQVCPEPDHTSTPKNWISWTWGSSGSLAPVKLGLLFTEVNSTQALLWPWLCLSL